MNQPKPISEIEGFVEGELVVYDNSGLPVSVSAAHTPTGEPPICLGDAILIAASHGTGKSMFTHNLLGHTLEREPHEFVEVYQSMVKERLVAKKSNNEQPNG